MINPVYCYALNDKYRRLEVAVVGGVTSNGGLQDETSFSTSSGQEGEGESRQIAVFHLISQSQVVVGGGQVSQPGSGAS